MQTHTAVPVYCSQVCKVARLFNPMHAAQHLTPTDVDELLAVVLPLSHHVDAAKLKAQVPIYLTAAKDVTTDRADVQAFTCNVLCF